uniref:Uncharacterized protein n=1 Tax=Nelumbo nucifera TaxID=4432 RepID=A0A822XK28_NELNU|nr:TPA_asm: hypothetical protein HUJ06_020628 [Nelumbo nucifera]
MSRDLHLPSRTEVQIGTHAEGMITSVVELLFPTALSLS